MHALPPVSLSPLAGSQFQRYLNSHFGVTLSEEEQRGVLRKYEGDRGGQLQGVLCHSGHMHTHTHTQTHTHHTCMNACTHTHTHTLTHLHTHTHTHIRIHLYLTRPMSAMRTVLCATLQASLLGQLDQLFKWNHYTGLPQYAAYASLVGREVMDGSLSVSQ